MMVVAVVNQKGGVAKTTTTANLGACLAARGHRTLLIDLDPQANLTLGLGLNTADLPYRLSDVLLDADEAPLEGIVRRVGELTLYAAPGHFDLSRAEAMLLPLGGKAFRLKHALEAFTEQHPFDWVLIDCPPSLGTLTQNAIVASSHLLIPTEPKFYSFQGMDTLNKMVVGLAKDLRFRVEVLGVLLTLYDRSTRLSRTIADEIRQRFGDRMFQTVIRRNVRLSEAEIEGRPIILFDRHSRGAADYQALADEVLARTGSAAVSAA